MLLVHLLQQQKNIGWYIIHFLQIFESKIYKAYVTIIIL